MSNQITEEELLAFKENRLKARTYENDEVVVYWQPRLCIHSANCFMGLPGVFNPQKRPWIMPEKGTAGEIIETIDTCPTRALLYQRKNEPHERQEEEPVADSYPAHVRILKNGPALISGNFVIHDSENNPLNHDGEVAAICRCGASKRKPFCDGSHLKSGFNDEIH